MYKHFFETTHLMHEQTDSLTALEHLKNYFFIITMEMNQ